MWFRGRLRKSTLLGCGQVARGSTSYAHGALGVGRSRLLEWRNIMAARIASWRRAVVDQNDMDQNDITGQKVRGARVLEQRVLQSKRPRDSADDSDSKPFRGQGVRGRISALKNHACSFVNGWRERSVELLFILPGILLATIGVALVVLPSYAVVLAAAFFFSAGALFLVVGFRAIKIKRQFEGLLLKIEGRVSVASRGVGTTSESIGAGGSSCSNAGGVRSPVSSTSLAALEGLDPKKILYH